MTSLDTLYLSLAIAALGITGAIWFVVIKIAKVLTDTQPILHDMKNITHDVKELEATVKESVVIKGLNFLSSILGKKEVK